MYFVCTLCKGRFIVTQAQCPKCNPFKPIPKKIDPNKINKPKITKASVRPTRKKRVFNERGAKCAHCGTEENLTIDHIIPRSKGGTNKIENLQVLCKKCNLKKADKMPNQFYSFKN